MHQTRQETISKIPITRKGTKYIVRARGYNSDAVPVLVAVRDMLKLARTAREVKSMVHQKLVSINGSLVKDYFAPIQLFHILKVGDKSYVLHLLPTKKFVFEQTKDNQKRISKVSNKHLLPKGKIQFNLIDGTNILSKEDIKVGDSVYLKLDGKVDSIVHIEKGKKAIVIAGTHAGHNGVVESVQGKKVMVKLNDSEGSVLIETGRIFGTMKAKTEVKKEEKKTETKKVETKKVAKTRTGDNPMREAFIEKIILSAGAVEKELEKSKKLLELISGMKAQIVQSNKRIPELGVSPGLEVGTRVTIRGQKAIDLLKRLLTAIDNIIKKKQISENHFSFGIKEYIEIPGLEYQRDIGIKGLNVTVVFARVGLRVKRKKIKSGEVPKKQFVTRDEIANYMNKNYGTVAQ